MSPLTRREVLKLILAGAGAALVPWPRPGTVVAQTASLPDVVVSKGASPVAITEAAVQALGGMGRFISRGDVVLVKPNIGWDRSPAPAATPNREGGAPLVRHALAA